MNYRTLANMAELIRANVARIPRVDSVVGIPRSGMIAASMIATLTNQPLNSITEVMHTGQSILLVDDSISGGTTMQQTMGVISKIAPHLKIATLAVYIKPSSPIPNIFLDVVPGPRVFEWNWHRSKHLSTAVLDIDGVISTPTQPNERNGNLLYRPARKVLALATGRHEHERAVTETWLEKHDVKYGSLLMSSPECRARSTKYAACMEFKPTWVVESDIHQAEWLRARTGLPILCTDANRML